MLLHSQVPSTIVSPRPSFTGNAIHDGNCILRLCHTDDKNIIPIHRSCNMKRFMLSNTEQVDFLCSDRIGETKSARKRPRSLRRMSKLPEEENRRQPAELSLFDKLVDKTLMLNGPSIIVLLTIITLLILPSDVAFYSGRNIAVSSIFWVLLGFQQVPKDAEDDDDQDDSFDFNAYFTATWCLGTVFLTYLLGPYDTRTEDVVAAKDTFFSSKVFVVTLLSVGLLSTSGLIALPHLGKTGDGEVDGKVEEDTLSTSAEKELMELWDQEMERSTKNLSDDNAE